MDLLSEMPAGNPVLAFDEAMDFGRLYKALKQCCRNVRWKDSVVGYEWNGLKNTYKLYRDIRRGRYKLSGYQIFMITEPKPRRIVATVIRDRQFQKVLCDYIVYPLLTGGFIEENCACQKGRGVDYCLKALKKHLIDYRDTYGHDGWVLKCDVRKYFDSTPHDTAKAALAKRIHDQKALEQCYRIIDSFEGERGIGLGSQQSQLTELAVLDDLDHLIKDVLGVKHYVRYMDDFVLIHPDKEYLKCCLSVIREHLAGLGLALNDKTCIYPLRQGVKMLQWTFKITGSGRILMRMNQKKMSTEMRKLRKLWERECTDRVVPGTTHDSLQSWLANAMRGDTFAIRKRMLAFYYGLTKRKEIFCYGQRKCREKARKDRSHSGQVQIRACGCARKCA